MMITARLNLTVMIVTDLLILSEILLGEKITLRYKQNQKMVLIILKAGWYIKRTSNYEFAAKAGDNKESHNHNDIGVFLLNVGGDKNSNRPRQRRIYIGLFQFKKI